MLEDLLQDDLFLHHITKTVSEYFRDEVVQEQFNEWYKKKYGKKHEQEEAYDK